MIPIAFIAWLALAGTLAETLAETPVETLAETPAAPDLPGESTGMPKDPFVLMVDGLAASEQQAGPDSTDRVIRPFSMAVPENQRIVVTDSISRWQLWSDHGEWMSRQPGVISFRQGGLGRHDGFLIRGHESRHQRFYLDGIAFSERIFGTSNYNRLPHYSRFDHVHEFSASTQYHSEFITQRYHVTRPLTLINYDQTTFDHRSTEGFLTGNLTPSTNISMAYWGKNEAEGYRNNRMNGRNASVSAYHYLNESWLMEGGFYYSGLQLGEPQRYGIGDMATFSFNHFEVFPETPNGRSSLRNTLFRVTAWHRNNNTSHRLNDNHQASTRISLYHDRNRRFHYATGDSTSMRTLTTGLAARHMGHTGPVRWMGDGYGEWSVIDRDRHASMDISSWFYSRGRLTASTSVVPQVALFSWMSGSWRSDGYAGYEAGAGFRSRPFSHLRGHPLSAIQLYGSYARGEVMPKIGHLYYSGGPLMGNPHLNNEILERIEAGLAWQSGTWSVRTEIHASRIRKPILAGQDTAFVQAGPYTSAGGMASLSRESRHWEITLSGTFQQYFSDDFSIESQLLDRSGQRVWTRASIHYKNNLFDRAAFVKTGFYLLASPSPYRSAQYYPEQDYWDPNSWNPDPSFTEAQAVPEFLRLDLDMTARVRSAFFLLRLENALDNWLVPGYFETAYLPMPAMRLRFGVRWVLRN